jgi:hypothetical protein
MSKEPQAAEDLEWREKLGGIGEIPEAPAWLEERVTDELRKRGVLREKTRARVRWVWSLAVATACLGCFVAGLLVERSFFNGGNKPRRAARTEDRRQSTGPSTRTKYLLLLIIGAETPAADSKAEAALVREYSAWAMNEHAAGRVLGGEKLNDLSVEIAEPSKGEMRRQNDPLGGYFVVSAADLETAVAIARTCPHLRHGGSIVIRPIDPTP